MLTANGSERSVLEVVFTLTSVTTVKFELSKGHAG